MKEELKQIIQKLFCVPVYFVDNWEDAYSGMEFNPDPHTLIQVKLSFPAKEQEEGQYINIDKHTIILYDREIRSKSIIKGQAIRLDDGFIDIEFYEKLLKNYKSF